MCYNFAMKKFFKIFLIFLYAVFTLGLNDCQAYNNFQTDVNSVISVQHNQTVQTSVFAATPVNDTSIASANNYGYEISSLKTDKENPFYSSENHTANNNFLRQKYKTYTNKILNSRLRNISPILAYEICTRAP